MIGILYINDLLDPPHLGAKLFEDLILDFEVSRNDIRKYNFLMKNIPSPWLEGQNFQGLDNFDRIFDDLVSTPEVPRYACCRMALTQLGQLMRTNENHVCISYLIM